MPPDESHIYANIDAEMGVLGSILFDNTMFDPVRAILTEARRNSTGTRTR